MHESNEAENGEPQPHNKSGTLFQRSELGFEAFNHVVRNNAAENGEPQLHNKRGALIRTRQSVQVGRLTTLHVSNEAEKSQLR